jgi:hypothetical protein
MTNHRHLCCTVGATVTRAAGTLTFCLAAIWLAVTPAPAAGQTCEATIASIESVKTSRVDHESQQKSLQDQIDRIDQGEKMSRQKLQSGDCVTEGAAATAPNDQRPSCKILLDMIMTAFKMRESLKDQIATLQSMATDAVGDEQKLVQIAKTGGCPPYATKTEAAKSTPKARSTKKKAVRKSRRRRAVRSYEQPPPGFNDGPRRGGVIIIGPGGIGFGF